MVCKYVCFRRLPGRVTRPFLSSSIFEKIQCKTESPVQDGNPFISSQYSNMQIRLSIINDNFLLGNRMARRSVVQCNKTKPVN